MYHVLLVGYDPKTEDFKEPDRPPGMTEAKIEAGIEIGVEQMRQRGWRVDVHLVPYHDALEVADRALAARLAGASYDCVVLGGGIRLPDHYLTFEAIVNRLRRDAPATPIAFNSGPEDSATAAERWLGTDGARRASPTTRA